MRKRRTERSRKMKRMSCIEKKNEEEQENLVVLEAD